MKFRECTRQASREAARDVRFAVPCDACPRGQASGDVPGDRARGRGATTSDGGATGGADGDASAGGSSSDALFDSGARDALPVPDGTCAPVTMPATVTPLDLYIAMDKSSSQAGTKWAGVKAGLAAFVGDPSSAGIRVAPNLLPLDNNPTCNQFA